MTIPAEFAKEFASFPVALRKLVEAELESGNTILAIEHGFPAAPCGASIKLAHAVGETRRKSSGEVSFYARNTSSYAGEFTTANRHFFVLEPPLPEPPPPDMDAIRKSLEAKSQAREAYRTIEDPGPTAVELQTKREPRSYKLNARSSPAARAFTNTERSSGWTRELYFRDERAPHEVQFALERELMVLFVVRLEHGQLVLDAQANIVGAHYAFELRFLAAQGANRYYLLRVDAAWEDSETYREYFRKTSDSWFQGWICDLMPAKPPIAEDTEVEHYRSLSEIALNAERHLDSVESVQGAIVEGMKRGGTYGTSHKEGGSNIFWRMDRFVRSDYGDDPDHKSFTTETEFLKMLWNFCQFDVTRHAGKGALSEFDTWKLILRRMSGGNGPH